LKSSLPILAITILYSFTLSTSLGPGDSGELTAVAYRLGVAHPPGYPLFTLLGHLFTLIPSGSIAFRTNLLSMVAGIMALLTLSRILRSDRTLSILAPLTLAFSFTFWAESSTFEVYTFELLLLLLSIYFLLRFADSGRESHLLMGLFTIGLGISHRPTFLLYLPGLLYLILPQRDKIGWVSLSLASLFLLLPLTSFLYLLIRAQHHPPLNWGNPDSFIRLINHATGAQYRSFLFTLPLSQVVHRLTHLPPLLLREFSPLLLLSLPGLYYFYTRWRRVFFALLLIAGANLIYTINYDIPDYDVFLLPTFLFIGLLLSSGLAFLIQWIGSRFGQLLSLLLLIPLSINLRNHQENRYPYLYDVAINLWRSIPDRAIFFCSSSTNINCLLYLQHVEGRKKGIDIVYYDMLGSLDYLTRLGKRIRLRPATGPEMIATVVELNPDRPVVIGIDLMKEALQLSDHYQLIPHGLITIITRDSVDRMSIVSKNDSLWQRFQIHRIMRHRLPRTRAGKSQMIYGIALNNLGAYYLNQGWYDEAQRILKFALHFPNRPDVEMVIRRNLALSSKRSNPR